MRITRRDFLEQGVGTVAVLGFSLYKLPRPGRAGQQKARRKVAEIPVLWLASGSCSGCSVALLNSAAPTIEELLLGQVIPGKHLSLAFHATVMAASGQQALRALADSARQNKGRYLLVVEGATATGADGGYCSIGEDADGQPVSGQQRLRDLGRDALATLAVGTCAAFGGIPAAAPNPTGCVPVGELFKRQRIARPVVNIPGCPPHPDWIVGTIAAVLIGGLEGLRLDGQVRPTAFFGGLVHDNCPYRGHFDRGEFARRFGAPGCLFLLGCKGAITRADCPLRRFNNGTSWCCQAGHPCIGCCHPRFPFEGSMFRMLDHAVVTGQVLDENHAGQSCAACHVDNRFDRLPSCGECHEPEEGISFPDRRPGPVALPR